MNKSNVYDAKDWEKSEAWARIGEGKFEPINFLKPTDILVYNDFQLNRFTIEELREYLKKHYVYKEHRANGPSTKFEIISVN